MLRLVLLYFIATLCLCSVKAGPVTELSLPVLPDSIRVPQQRADYLLLHFWDAMDWSDTALSRDSAFMELNLVNYFSVAPHASADGVSAAFNRLMACTSADTAAMRLIDSYAHRYLGEQASPVYHEGVYEQMCRALLRVQPPTSPQAVYTAYQLENLEKNPVGSLATDFVFVDRYGERRQLLASLAPESRTLLVFFDPDCHDCHALASTLSVDADIASQIAAKRLQIAFIAPYADSEEQWQQYAASLPSEWIVGYYQQDDVDFDDLYYVASIPSVYILAPGGVVERRNATSL